LDLSTRAEAITKLHKLAPRIAFPDKWISYAGLSLDRTSHLGNVLKAQRFTNTASLAQIGQPLDRQAWVGPTAFANAFYDPSSNSITVPTGIMDLPFFDPRASLLNFSELGMVVGHEMTHGFDNSGRHFDGDGTLRNWWSDSAATEFNTRAQCLVDQYSKFSPAPGLFVDGKRTLGENIADHGGMRLAIAVLKSQSEQLPPVAGLNGAQQFFVSYGQMWCTKVADDYVATLLKRDVHSPAKFRVNGVLSNQPEFADAFQCAPGKAMNPPARCQVW
jgi:endothelin-converting enzyme/putative endopeptidase